MLQPELRLTATPSHFRNRGQRTQHQVCFAKRAGHAHGTGKERWQANKLCKYCSLFSAFSEHILAVPQGIQNRKHVAQHTGQTSARPFLHTDDFYFLFSTEFQLHIKHGWMSTTQTQTQKTSPQTVEVRQLFFNTENCLPLAVVRQWYASRFLSTQNNYNECFQHWSQL